MPQRRIEDNLVAGLPGMAYASAHATESLSALNDDPRAKQIITFTVGTSSTEGSVFLEGLEIESDTGLADESAVAADLVSKINAEGLVNGVLEAEQSTADVVVTAKVGGTGFAYADGTNTTAAETQANATASPVPFGRLVVADGQSAQDGELLAKLPSGDIADALGVAKYTASFERAADEDGEYPANSRMNVQYEGPIYVKTEDTAAVGDDVYVRHTVDGDLDELGGFASASGTGLSQLTGAKWLRGTGTGTLPDDVAVLQLNL